MKTVDHDQMLHAAFVHVFTSTTDFCRAQVKSAKHILLFCAGASYTVQDIFIKLGTKLCREQELKPHLHFLWNYALLKFFFMKIVSALFL